MLENPENLLNKYNRTLGKAFIDGRSYVFAVILANRGSDKVNLHQQRCEPCQALCSQGVGKNKKTGKQNGLLPREKMETKLSITDVETHLSRFRDIAPGFEIKLGELKDDSYIYILRDDRKIGCFKRYQGDIIFELHSSYISVGNLTNEDIKNAILRTRGENYGA
jgi:hypothetical protein